MKTRLIWNEYLPHAESLIYPYISFDNGISWMDIKDEVDYLRNVGERHLNNISTKNGITEMDISVGFTPYSIPTIEKLEYVMAGDGVSTETNFISSTATTYYFAIGAINYDTPGLYKADETEHISYSGPINPDTSVPYMSNVKSIDIPNDGKYYNINIYVNYPEFVEGLAIYYGLANTSLNLMSITNLHQKLDGSPSSTVITAGVTTSVVLANIFPFPTATGTVKIDNEYLEYTAQEFDGTNWILTLNAPATENHSGESTVIYCLPDDTRQVPEKIYFFPNTNNMIEYINFDASNVIDLVDHSSEMDYVSPSTVGTIEYSTFMSKFRQSYKLVGNTCIRTNLSATNRNAIKDTGSIHFYLALSSFDDSNTDPYIFGTYDTTGLYCRISKFNSKPYLGFRFVEGTEIVDTTIFSFEDFRIPVLKKSEFSDIGIAWSKDTDNNMIFYLVIDGITSIQTKTTISSTDFDLGAIDIGGLYNGSSVVNSFVGYLDDWRIYNKNLADGSYNIMFADINKNHYQDINRFAGKIKLGTEFIDVDATLASYDTASAMNLLSDETASGGDTYYTPAFYTNVSLPYSATYEIDEPLVKYDNWVISSYIAGGWTSLVTNITYPVRPETIKIKYELLDDNTGFYTPILGNPSVIISEMTV